MKHFWVRLCSVVLALCLFCGAAAAELAWADGQLAALLPGERPTGFSLTMQLNELQPFGKEILAMLNETLLQLQVEGRLEGETSQMALCVGGESLLTVTEAPRDGHMALCTSLLPNRLLLSAASPMDVLSGNPMAQQPLFELYTAVEQVEGCWQTLAQGIVPFATEKKASYTIEDIGRCRWVRLAKLAPEDSATLLPAIIAVLECGMDDAFRLRLQNLTCGEDFTIALYSDKEGGTPLALYMKGTVYLAPEEKWTLAYQWAFTREEGSSRDTYRYELLQSKAPKHKRVVDAQRLITDDGEKLTFTRRSKLTVKEDTLQQVVTHKDSLTALRTDAGVELTGSLKTEVKDQTGKETVTTTTLTPTLAVATGLEGNVLGGNAVLEQVEGKKTLYSIVFTFADAPALTLGTENDLTRLAQAGRQQAAVAGSSLAQNTAVAWPGDPAPAFQVGAPPLGVTVYTPPQELETVNLDTADPARRQALLDEMAQNAAGALLTALARLPGQPLTLLTDNMTAEDYQLFLSLLGDL